MKTHGSSVSRELNCSFDSACDMCNCADCHIIFKRVQLSGAQKRKLPKKKPVKTLDLESKAAKLTVFFTQVPQYDIPILDQNQSPSSEV